MFSKWLRLKSELLLMEKQQYLPKYHVCVHLLYTEEAYAETGVVRSRVRVSGPKSSTFKTQNIFYISKIQLFSEEVQSLKGRTPNSSD